MRIDDLGEFGFIERFSKPFLEGLGENVVGIGDDCSVTELNEHFFQIATTDLLVEDVHFVRDKISPFDLGRKAMAVNVSDIAAMGGVPENAHLSLGVPGGARLSYLDDFFRGVKSACDACSVRLLGGDTTKSPDRVVINVSIQGKVEKGRVKLRSTARSGDVVCLTGTVGDSGIGLAVVLGGRRTASDDYFVDRHNNPVPHLKEGRWLSRFGDVHAMIDVSDGVASDLDRVCERSRLRGEVELSAVPLSDHAEAFFKTDSGGRLEAASSGEDYCLLAAVDPRSFSDLSKEFKRVFARPLHKIGTMGEGAGVSFTRDGKRLEKPLSGHDHFRRLP